MLYKLIPSFGEDCHDSHSEYASLPIPYYGHNDAYIPDLLEEECYGNPEKDYAPAIPIWTDRNPLLVWLNRYGNGPRLLHDNAYLDTDGVRNNLYYAMAYAAFFKMASRLLERDRTLPTEVGNREYHALGQLEIFYRDKAIRILQAKIVFTKNQPAHTRSELIHRDLDVGRLERSLSNIRNGCYY